MIIDPYSFEEEIGKQIWKWLKCAKRNQILLKCPENQSNLNKSSQKESDA